jgi:hypothetical protein
MTKHESTDVPEISALSPSSIIATGETTGNGASSFIASSPSNKDHHDEPNTNVSTGNVTAVVKNISDPTAITSRTESFNQDDTDRMLESQPPPPALDETLNITNGIDSRMIHIDDTIDPPITITERYRDTLLRTFDLPIFQYIGIFIIVGVVIDGAIFFFLLMGWHTLCHPVTDCEPRNTVYNISIQILNGFFTYMAIVEFLAFIRNDPILLVLLRLWQGWLLSATLQRCRP